MSIVKSLEKLDMTESRNGYLPAFNPRALAQLEICERAVERRLTVKQPERKVLDELLRDIRENIQEVIDADIEEEVRQLLLEMLRAVERALLAYDVSGLPGLRAAVERTTGAAAQNGANATNWRCHGPVCAAERGLVAPHALQPTSWSVGRGHPEEGADLLRGSPFKHSVSLCRSADSVGKDLGAPRLGEGIQLRGEFP